jgi:hypothetical protein
MTPQKPLTPLLELIQKKEKSPARRRDFSFNPVQIEGLSSFALFVVILLLLSSFAAGGGSAFVYRSYPRNPR